MKHTVRIIIPVEWFEKNKDKAKEAYNVDSDKESRGTAYQFDAELVKDELYIDDGELCITLVESGNEGLWLSVGSQLDAATMASFVQEIRKQYNILKDTFEQKEAKA